MNLKSSDLIDFSQCLIQILLFLTCAVIILIVYGFLSIFRMALILIVNFVLIKIHFVIKLFSDIFIRIRNLLWNLVLILVLIFFIKSSKIFIIFNLNIIFSFIKSSEIFIIFNLNIIFSFIKSSEI